MKSWTYHASPALQQSFQEQLTVFPREPDMTSSLMRLAWNLGLRAFLRTYFRLKVHGRKGLPAEAFVVVANHSSHLDAVALSTIVPLRALDRTFSAAARDYFFSSFIRSFFSAIFINALPFNRDGKSKASLELCADILGASGNVLIMFPEGTRSTNGEIQAFHRGIGQLVAGTSLKVVPAYLSGAFNAWPKGERIPRPRRVSIHIGPPVEFSHVPRDKEGFSRVARELENHVRALKPQPSQGATMSLKHLLARAFLRTLGRTSNGVRLCFDTGLTSGKMVDYVYRNEPSGRLGIGKWIDRNFLSNPGWEAVRLRRQNLETLMKKAVENLRHQNTPVSILDIASGPGSYVIAVVEAVGEADLQARCCDFDERWVKEGQREVETRGLKSIRFQTGDAFDAKAILAYEPRPNLAVSSGFYDWITEDEEVQKSLAILHEALTPGGYLVLTNQVDHPDLTFVSEVFTDFNQQPLRMKLRPATQIREWLEKCGFTVEETLVDPKGYYSVSLARKP